MTLIFPVLPALYDKFNKLIKIEGDAIFFIIFDGVRSVELIEHVECEFRSVSRGIIRFIAVFTHVSI